MARLFEPIRINGLDLPNRAVRSATWLGLADEAGAPTEAIRLRLADLARHEVGLIVNGHAFVSSEGQVSARQQGIHRDDLIPAHRALTQAVHAAGGRIAAQLTHGGAFGKPKLSGCPAVCFHPTPLTPPDGHPLDETGRERLVSAFAAAATRARAAGYDAVQLHGAHGYLIWQSLTPLFHPAPAGSTDAPETRARFGVAVVRAVRSAIGPDMPLLMKLNSADFEPGGLEIPDTVAIARRLVAAGLDAIEVSGGLLTSRTNGPTRLGVRAGHGEGYFRDAARALQAAGLGIPIILVGGLRSPDFVEQVLTDGTADLAAFCRPLLHEPGLLGRWRAGDLRPSRCLSDNRCFRPGLAGLGVRCESPAAPPPTA